MKPQNNDAMRAVLNGITEVNIQMRFLITAMKERNKKSNGQQTKN